MTRLFVTGTDTDVGKTFVSAAMLRQFAARGASALGLKLFASGCTRAANGELVSEDAELLAGASTLPVPESLRCPYRFAPAVAPGLAAEQSGIAIDFDRLAAAIAPLHADLLLVEGAGGLLCPLGQARTVADFAMRLAFPLVIVARASLGTINHTLLTVEAARRRSLVVHAVLLNNPHDKTPPAELAANAEQISRYGQVRVFSSIELFADAEAAKQLVEHPLV